MAAVTYFRYRPSTPLGVPPESRANRQLRSLTGDACSTSEWPTSGPETESRDEQIKALQALNKLCGRFSDSGEDVPVSSTEAFIRWDEKAGLHGMRYAPNDRRAR